jgi:hypothetical protein
VKRRRLRNPIAIPLDLRFLSAFIPLLLLAAGPPPVQIVRLAVPRDRLNEWLPPDREPRSLPREEFERLATQFLKPLPPPPDPEPLPLSTTHRVRWENGILLGESRFRIQADQAEAWHILPLDPWSPAVDPTASGDLRTLVGGKIALIWQGGDQRESSVHWRQAASPGSNGLDFPLALPHTAIDVMELNLPDELEPWLSDETVLSSTPDLEAGRTIWRSSGPRSSNRLRLRNRHVPESQRRWDSTWVSINSKVQLGASLLRLRADLSIDFEPGADRSIDLQIPPSLDLVNIEGASLLRSEPSQADPHHYHLTFDPDAPSSTQIVIQTLGKVPSAGPWPIPSLALPSSVIRDSQTQLSIDRSWLVDQVEPLNGALSPQPLDLDQPTSPADVALRFVSTAPGPVARIHLQHRSSQARARIQGRLTLHQSGFLASATIRWADGSQLPSSIPLEIDEQWRPQRILWQTDPPTIAEWSLEANDRGKPRLLIRAPASRPARSLPELEIVARSDHALNLADFPLPHLKPLNCAIIDDEWRLSIPRGWVVLPRALQGCEWIAPDQSAPPPPTRPREDSETAETIAWRWIDPNASPRIGCVRTLDRIADWDVMVVHFGSLGWRLNAILQPELQDLEFLWSDELARNAQWEWIEITPADPGPSTPRVIRRIQPQRLGPGHYRLIGSAQADRGGVIACSLVQTESPPNPLPIPLRRSDPHARTRLILTAEPGLLPRFDPGQLKLLDRLPAMDQIRAQLGPELSARLEQAVIEDSLPTSVAELAEPVQQLHYSIENDADALPSAWIPRLSAQTTWLDPGSARHELNLAVFARSADFLDLSLFPGVRVDQLRRDGRPVEPLKFKNAVRLPLQSGRWNALQLELHDNLANPTQQAMRWPLADLGSPVLSSLWAIDAPDAIKTLPGTPRQPHPFDPVSSAEPMLARILPRGDGILSRQQWHAAVAQSSNAPAETFMNLLERLQQRAAPIIVDRFALDRLGIQPDSRVEISSPAAAEFHVDPLAELGLAAWIGTDAVLIHDRRESFPDRSETLRACLEALRNGQDRSDRFQTLDRFRASRVQSMGIASANRTGTPGPQPFRRQELLGLDVPHSVTWEWVDLSARLRWFLTGLFLLLAVSALIANAPGAGQSLWLGSLIVASIVLAFMDHPALNPWRDLLIAGAGLTAVIWIGLSRARTGAFSTPDHSTSMRTQPLRLAAGSSSTYRLGAVLFLLAECLLAIQSVAAQMPATSSPLGRSDPPSPSDRSPIIAFIPYDGAPDPANTGDRVFLSRRDDERLRNLESRRSDPRASTPLWFQDARHVLSPHADGSMTLSHQYEIHLAKDQPAEIAIPTGEGVDWKARCDGRPIPVRFGPAPRTLHVEIRGAGTHRLEITRTLLASTLLRLRQDLQIPVLPVATAQAVIDKNPAPPAWELQSVQSLLQADASITRALVGPAHNLTFRPSGRPGSDPQQSPQGRLDATWLWQILPAGDRVQSRWQNRGNVRIDQITLRLDPEITLRKRSPGLTLLAKPSADQNVNRELELQFDPPLHPGAAFELEFWKPAPQPERRAFPRIEVRGLARHSGILGLARPDRDHGRLKVAPPLAIPDQLFEQSWGASPDPGFTFAGALRFEGLPEVEFLPQNRDSPLPIQPTLWLELQDRRLLWTLLIEGENLRSPLGADLMLDLPLSLVISQVQADGLESWELSSTRRVLLHPSPGGAPIRTVRLTGWIPLESSDAASSSSNSGQIPLPWPSFPGCSPRDPTLILAAESDEVLEPAPDTELTRIQLPSLDTSITPNRPARAYRINRIGSLRWQSQPPGCDIRIDSSVELHPGLALWTSVLRLSAPSGPVSQLILRMPEDWKNPRVELDAASVRLSPSPTPAPAGSRDWTLEFAPPILGARRISVHSEKYTTNLNLLQLPDLLPIGRGTRSVQLRWLDLSGEHWSISSHDGVDLQLLEPEPLRDPVAMLSSPPPARIARVNSDRWSIALARPAEISDRIDLVDTFLTIDPAGAAIGHATFFRPFPDDQPLLVRIPAPMQLIDARADGQAVAARSGPDPAVTIRFPRPVRRIDLLWRLPPKIAQSSPMIPLPEPAVPVKQWLLACYAPQEVALQSNATPASPQTQEFARIQSEIDSWETRIQSGPDRVPAQHPLLLAAAAQRLNTLEQRIHQARSIRHTPSQGAAAPSDAQWQSLANRSNALAARAASRPPSPLPQNAATAELGEAPWDLPRPGVPRFWISNAAGTPGPPPTLACKPPQPASPVSDALIAGRTFLFQPLTLSALLLSAIWLLKPLRPGMIAAIWLGLFLAGLLSPLGFWAWIQAAVLALTRFLQNLRTPAGNLIPANRA